MISWWIIGAIALFLTFHFLFGKKLKWIKFVVIVLVAVFLYTSVVGIVNSGDYDLNSARGVFSAVQGYISWTGNTIKELFEIGKNTVDQVGEAVKFDESKMNT